MLGYDLIDFILENDRLRKIGPINKIKSAIFSKAYLYSFPNNIESVCQRFKNVANCVVTVLVGPGEFDQH